MFQKDSLCKIEGCENPARANHMCRTHNMRSWRGKDLHTAGTRSGTATAFIRSHVDSNLDECISWPFARNKSGYADVNFPGMKGMLGHRVMCVLAHGEPPSREYHAAHSCGRGQHGCINPNHLSWKTPQENIDDKALHGTQPWGDQIHFAKLTLDQAKRIKHGSERGIDLASEMGVLPQTIYNIRSGRTWKGI